MRFITTILIMFAAVVAYGRAGASELLVDSLDSVLAQSDQLAEAKEARIGQLRKKESAALKDEERLWLNKMLFDEYAVYKADSAMNYVNDNIELARRLGRKGLENEWRINKVFLLAAQGLLYEAEKELATIDEGSISDDARYAYYETAIYLYSHLAQYIGHSNGMSERYDSISNALKTEALRHVKPGNQEYYNLRSSMLSGPSDPEWAEVKARLEAELKETQLNNRTAAIAAYNLAKMCLAEGDKQGHADNLIKSAIADVRMCNRDIASLEELANLYYEQGDIDRSYAYINHCLEAALLYPNRVRVVNISSLIDKLQQATERRSIEQERKLGRALLAVSILSGVLLLVMVIIFVQFFKLRSAHARLMDSKVLLNKHNDELHVAQEKLSGVNRELITANEKLRRTNDQLVESNYVKEEYVGYVFSICSSYLTKIEEFRKNIARKLKVGKIDDVRTLIQNPQIEQNELREFYQRFDTTFLHLYPSFVDDFNSLLQPEERIVLKKGELLNTELRIYALVRLGINDSVKIAEFLHMSPQTVYNNRLKTRNKAIVPKNEFVDHVRRLGKNS